MTEAIELNPGDAEAWHNKGLALSGEGKYDEALQAFDVAIEINPQFAKAWFGKAFTLIRSLAQQMPMLH